MAIEVLCPSCETKLRVKDELAGRVAGCPRCQQKLRIPGVAVPGTLITAAAVSEPAAAETGFGHTFSPDPMRADTGAGVVGAAEWSWETLRIGLRIVQAGAITGLCGTIAFGLGSLGMQFLVSSAMRGAGGGGGMSGMLFWTMLIFGGVVAAYSQLVVMLTGWACCRSAPGEIPETTRTWSTLAVAGGGAGIAAVLAMFMLPQLIGFGSGAAVGTLLKLMTFMAVAAVLAGYACFGGFVRGLGEHFRDPGLRLQSLGFMVYQGAIGVWTLLQMFAFGGGPNQIPGGPLFSGRDAGIVMLLIQVVIGIVHFMWLRNLSRKATRQVDFHMRSI